MLKIKALYRLVERKRARKTLDWGKKVFRGLETGERKWKKSPVAEMLEKRTTKVSALWFFVPLSNMQTDVGCSLCISVETHGLRRIFKILSAFYGIPQSENKQHHWDVFSEASWLPRWRHGCFLLWLLKHLENIVSTCSAGLYNKG